MPASLDDWTDALAVADLVKGDVTEVAVGGRLVALFDTADGLFATAAHCTHAGAPLVDGYLDGCVIECPLHQGCFDVRDGRAMGPPVTRDLMVFEVRTVDERIQVRRRTDGHA